MVSEQIKEALRQYKCPETNDKYVGIELEFSCPTPSDVLIERVVEAHLQSYLHMGHDGGAYAGEEAHEWRILVKQKDMERVLKCFGKLISEAGGKFHPSSGFHVHIDMRKRSPAKVFNNLVKAQPILFAIAAPMRSTSHWCKKNHSSNIDECNDNKYQAINPILDTLRKNTIEIRIRESVVDGVDIFNWVKLLVLIANSKKIKPQLETFSLLITNVKLPKYIRDYIKSKLKQHNQIKILKGA